VFEAEAQLKWMKKVLCLQIVKIIKHLFVVC